MLSAASLFASKSHLQILQYKFAEALAPQFLQVKLDSMRMHPDVTIVLTGQRMPISILKTSSYIAKIMQYAALQNSLTPNWPWSSAQFAQLRKYNRR